jgi:gliding motility-associated-like protein
MCSRKLLLFLFLFFVCNKVFAVTFVVTSNADSGPGTLRQALLDAAANGTATADIITFNLPNATLADITITVQTQLPDVSGNLTIDGTTEPGLPLGVSNAHIIITPATPSANINGLNISNGVTPTQTVAIYGLYIDGFSPNQSTLGAGIISNAPCVLTIGAPGKGNVISGNSFALIGNFQNASIQSNFIGLAPDGETVFNNATGFYAPAVYNNLVIGGSSPLEGNVMIGGSLGGVNFGGSNTGVLQSVLIQNNFFNTDYKGTTSLSVANNSCILVNDPNTSIEVVSNVFSASEIAISGVNKSEMVVTGNFFGTDLTQTFALGNGTNAIQNSGQVGAIIGGTTPATQNVFTNYQNPINCYNNSITDVIQNIFYCNTEVQLNDPTGVNFIRITTLTNNSVGGDAPAGAIVQLYYTDNIKCPSNCNPYSCFATVTANSNGKWQYTGSQPLNVLASSTVGNNTVGFQFDSLAKDEVTITNFDCQNAAGSVVLKEPRQGNFQFNWTNSSGTTVSTSQNLTGVPAGTYTLQISENGGCPSVTSGSFTILDVTPKAYGQSEQLNCSTPTASFTAYPSTGPGITVANYYWEDSQGNILSTTNTVNNLTAGNYSFYIIDSKGCTSNKALIQVLPATPTPVIDVTNAVETDATCNLSNGSVKGITVTNASGASYGWSTVGGQQLDYGQLNLTNAPPGQYYFYVFYDFNCPPVTSKTFTINEADVVTLDDSQKSITPSTCQNSNGAVSGIVTTGATSYSWYNAANPGNVVGNAINLSNVPAGNYYLVAGNGTCSQTSATYTIPNIPAFTNFPSTYTLQNAYCNLANGSIDVSFSSAQIPSSYRWANTAGTTLQTNAPLQKVPAGTYSLYVTDSNGCESLYQTYTVAETPAIAITSSQVQIVSDQCLEGLGSISGAQVSGGFPPYSYYWFNSNGSVVGSSLNLSNLQAGTYTLQVQDTTACGLASQTFTIPNQTAAVTPPVVPDVQVCGSGPVVIQVQSPVPGYGYRLYQTATSTDTLQVEATGLFTLTVSKPSTFYVTQYIGDCESPRVPVNINFSLSDLVIPNTFTPNNDGVNDYWAIKGIETYPRVLVQIFTRYGQKVFESRGYAQPFDGNYGQAKLPPGVYYYIINLDANCSLLSGSLTLIR